MRLKVDIKKLFLPNKIFINGYFHRSNGDVVLNNNWGDDINISFIQEISHFNIIVKNTSSLYRRLPIKAYNCIGSLIGYYTDKHTSIWGSGIISEDMPIPHKPLKVYSVRGPLTRNVLLKHGIDCPEKYGDPALLVSRYYRPRISKTYEYGLIPHYTDEENPALIEFYRAHPDILIIRMRGYNHWHDIPDQILSCKKIISSSLHGLIISDSYGVPNAWVRFSDDIKGGSFKYLDYFSSVGRATKEPIIIKSHSDLESVIINNYFELAKDIDYGSIFNACPFKESLKKYWKATPQLPQYSSIQDKDKNYLASNYIDTKEELDKQLVALEAMEEGVLFRGIYDASYKMFSSSQRHWLQNTDWVYRTGDSDYYNFIQKLANKCKTIPEVEDYVKTQNVSPNDMFCLALLQHFGAPSPMLDFSHNMRKALFFAVDGLKWDGIEKGDLRDYVSLYYIPKCVDWVYTTCQRVMESAAQDVESMLADFIERNPNARIDSEEILHNFSNLTFSQFRPDGTPHNITFLPLGGPADGRVKISIPSLNFSCDYLIINDRLLSQEGMFIMNNTINRPLVELMNEMTANKYFRCINIHKKLVPYIAEKYLKPSNINNASAYCEGDMVVEALQSAINKI